MYVLICVLEISIITVAGLKEIWHGAPQPFQYHIILKNDYILQEPILSEFSADQSWSCHHEIFMILYWPVIFFPLK